MADPWEGVGDATVTTAPAGDQMPWEGLGDNVQIVEAPPPNDVQAREATSSLTERWLDVANSALYANEQVMKGSLVGALVNPIAALWTLHAPEALGGLSAELRQKAPNLTYSDVLEVYNERDEREGSTGLQIIGALASGGVLGKALVRGAEFAAVRSGMVDGAMKWAARSAPVNRVVGAAAAGGAGGAVEEAIRSNLDETVKWTAGEGFSPSQVVLDTLTGAWVGAMFTPALQEGASGGRALLQWVKGMSGASEAQSAQAAQRIYKVFANPGENVDDAVKRMADKATEFERINGYKPAVAELLPPEKVRDLGAVIGVFNGLDIPAREYSEAGIKRVLGAYRNAITSGRQIASPEAIRADVEDLFTDVAQRYGSTPVSMTEDAMETLGRNKGWVQARANNGNEGAQRIARVLDARDKIGQARVKAGRLVEAVDITEAEQGVRDLEQQIADIISDQFNASDVEPSELAALRNLLLQARAKANSMKADIKNERARFDASEFAPTVRAMEKALADYEANGLKISLSDANHLRAAASKAAFADADFDRRDTARAIRDAIAPVGTKEVPIYGDVVKQWNLENVRAEAQDTGAAAAMGTIDPMDLATRVRRGRLPSGQRATGDVMTSATRGTGEGTLRTLRNEVDAGPQSGIAGARRVAENDVTREGVQMTAPGRSAAIIARAKQVGDTYRSMAALAGRQSPSQLQEEMVTAKELFSGPVIHRIGGAGFAALMSRIWIQARIPRGTARRLVDMLGDPDQIDYALRYMQDKGVRLGALTGAMSAALAGSE